MEWRKTGMNDKQQEGTVGKWTKILIAKNVPRTAIVIMAHSEYVQFPIVMIDAVHLGTQLPQCPSWRWRQYILSKLVRIDTVSKPDSLGVYLHPALKQAMFRAPLARGSCCTAWLLPLADFSGAVLICVGCCVCAYRGLEILGSTQDAIRWFTALRFTEVVSR